jgi:phosphoribosylanthranilate isomerase
VGVFVDEDRNRMIDIIQECGLRRVQLHGSESPDYAAALPVPVIRAIRIRKPLIRLELHGYPAEAFLLDPRDPRSTRGGGETFDWSFAYRIGFRHRIFIAGGLTPENVGRAVKAARPFGVDVSSGVERSPGAKDEGKMKKFIREANLCTD